MNKLLPRQPVPMLSVNTVSGRRWTLADQAPERFTMVVFYRGLHCPVCRTYISELDKLLEDIVQNTEGLQQLKAAAVPSPEAAAGA